MKNDNIIIYAEGSLKLGLGNIYRSISLGDALLYRQNCSIEFVTSSEEYVRNIIPTRYSVTFKPNQSSAFDYINQTKPNIVIVDYLGINSALVESLKNNGIKVAIIGNNSDANQYSNLVVNAIIGTNFKNSNTVDAFGTRYLQGPKYLVLRNEFEEKRNTYEYRDKLQTIMLMFGGTDQANYSFRVLEKLVRESIFKGKIKIILGAGYNYLKELSDLIDNNNLRERVSVLQNIVNVSEELLASDFLLTSPGTSLFEAFCLGIPSIGFYQNESQESVFKGFSNTLRYDSSLDLTELVLSVYNDRSVFRNMLNELCVGMGRDEIIDHLINL
jgi:spore coat polysaccharide biosynthesis predicted glycosyltransferase SpsG